MNVQLQTASGRSIVLVFDNDKLADIIDGTPDRPIHHSVIVSGKELNFQKKCLTRNK